MALTPPNSIPITPDGSQLSEAEDINKQLMEQARQRRMSDDDFRAKARNNEHLRKQIAETTRILKEQAAVYDRMEQATEGYVNNIERSRKIIKDNKFLAMQELETRNRTKAILSEINNIHTRINRSDIDSRELNKIILKNQERINGLRHQDSRNQELYVKSTQKLSGILKSLPKEAKITKSDIDFANQYGQKRIDLESELAKTTDVNEKKRITKDLTKLDNKYAKIIDKVNDASIPTDVDSTAFEAYNIDLKRLKAEKEAAALSYQKVQKQAEINKLIKDNVDLVERINTAEKMGQKNQLIQDSLKEQTIIENSINSIREEAAAIDSVNDLLESQYDRIEQVTVRLGTLGKAMGILKNTKFGRMFDLDEVSEAMNASAKQNLGTFKILGNGAKAFMSGTGFKLGLQAAAIDAVITAAKFMIESMFIADTRVTNLAKSFGIAKDEAQGLYDVFEDRNNILGINMDDLINAQIKFNDTFGVAVMMSQDFVATMAQATKLIGLSEEAQRGLAENSVVQDEKASDYMKTISGTSKLMQMQNGIMLNDKKILDSVLKVTGNIRANFRGNVEELTKAVTKASMLGTTLDQVDKFGASTLDWESSINAELEAELITGKQLNLERARAYALAGDTAKLTDEMVSQMGDIDGFFKMNTIQREAFSKAFGMDKNEVADMLYQKAFMEKMKTIDIGKKISEKDKDRLSKDVAMRDKYTKLIGNSNISEEKRIELMGRLVTENLSQLSAQQKFEEMLTKVKEKLATIFGNGAILDAIADGLVKFLRFFNLLDSSVKTQSEEKADALIKTGNLSNDEKSTLQETPDWLDNLITINKWLNPFVSRDLVNQMRDGQKEQRDKIFTKYAEKPVHNDDEDEMDKALRGEAVNDSLIASNGRIKISTPRGMIVPHRNDSIITTTEPNRLLSGQSGGSTSIDINPLVEELRQLRQETKENARMLANIYRENKDVYMDSTKVGSGIKNQTYKS